MEINFKNKNFCYLGDSITDGVGVNHGERYFELLAQKFGFNPFGYGVNGATSADIITQIDKMIEINGQNVDLISIFIGTNDFNSSTPIGTFFEETEETVCVLRDENKNPLRFETRKKRAFIYDNSTFCGRLNSLFKELKKHYPNVETFIMTPIHRAYAEFSNDNIQYNELYSNSIGLFIDDYVETIKKCAEIWSVKLIDLYRESGLFPLSDTNAEEYFCNVETDRLHPNKNGHRRLAEIIEKYY